MNYQDQISNDAEFKKFISSVISDILMTLANEMNEEGSLNYSLNSPWQYQYGTEYLVDIEFEVDDDVVRDFRNDGYEYITSIISLKCEATPQSDDLDYLFWEDTHSCTVYGYKGKFYPFTDVSSSK